MNYFSFAFLSIGIGICITSCHSTSADLPVLQHQRFNYAGNSRCDTAKNVGIDVSIDYFLLQGNSQGDQIINDSLRTVAASSITNWLDSTTVASNPEARTDLAKAAGLFATDYEAMHKDMGSLGGCWELKTTADTLYTNTNVLTFKFETFAFTGGAHPNTNAAFYTFERKTGRRLMLPDMIADTLVLLGRVEKAFRKQQEIQPQANLEEQGYFLRDGRFFLPANIGLGKEGLICYYNPYEIAAYAVGPIQVTIPYADLKDILHKGVLSN